MEIIKHRVTHYWSHRAESFEAQRLREYDSEKRERWLAEFFRSRFWISAPVRASLPVCWPPRDMRLPVLT